MLVDAALAEEKAPALARGKAGRAYGGPPGLSDLHLGLDRHAQGHRRHQRNICHFLRSANALYGFTAEDVVFQGASVAFDLSMEEIWVPYMVGATSVVATPGVIGRDATSSPTS